MRERRLQGLNRPHLIATAALRLIGSTGISNLTVASIAAEVGVTPGALFRHFGSREEILDAVVDIAIGNIDATAPHPALPPLERIMAFARARIDLAAREPGIAWLLGKEQAVHALSSGAAWRLDAALLAARRSLLDAITQGATAGEIRTDHAPEALLATVAGTIDYLARRARGEVEPALAALVAMLAPPRA